MDVMYNKQEFNEKLNISYVDESLPKPSNELILKHYAASISVYFFVYLFLLYNPFLSGYSLNFRDYYVIFYRLYIVLAPIILFIFRPKSLYKSHNIEIVNYFFRVFSNIRVLFDKSKSYKEILSIFKPEYYEKQSIMLIFIKVFFGSIMVHGLVNDFNAISSNVNKYKEIVTTLFSSISSGSISASFPFLYQKADYIYRQILLFLFTIDLLIFSIGYCTELAMLNNKIRTVEVTPLGIFVCLICYPPFNNVTSAIIGGNLTDAALTPNPVLTFIGRVLILFFTLIFVLASVALGTKGSNLTNRGIVSKFPYNIVRHPAYASKISFWFIALMMLLYNNNYDLYFLHSFETIANIIFIIVSFSITVFIYYMRAITEERHLMQDPEYREYADKVKYRFIPYII